MFHWLHVLRSTCCGCTTKCTSSPTVDWMCTWVHRGCKAHGKRSHEHRKTEPECLLGKHYVWLQLVRTPLVRKSPEIAEPIRHPLFTQSKQRILILCWNRALFNCVLMCVYRFFAGERAERSCPTAPSVAASCHIWLPRWTVTPGHKVRADCIVIGGRDEDNSMKEATTGHSPPRTWPDAEIIRHPFTGFCSVWP